VTSKINWTRRIAGLFLLLGAATAALAQLPTATLLGVVKDSSGAVVAGATLTARNQETGQTRTTVSAANGDYRLQALPVGIYEVRAEQSGFRAEVRGGLTLTVGQEAVLNFSLELGAVEQTVSVTADAPLVNTTSGSLGGLVDERKVADLPLNGRNYINLTLMQTGVMEHKTKSPGNETVGTWFSSNGAPVRSNSYMLDGALMQGYGGTNTSSVSGSTLGIEGIREYRVITNSFSAEYGMTMGSQMVIVSKGGSNNFHGSAFEYLRNSVLDARDFFDRQTALTPGRLPPFKRNNFGAAFGGPIKKDKTFFFGVYEGLRERKGVTTVSNTLPAGCRGSSTGTVTNTDCPALVNLSSLTIAPVVRPLVALFPLANLPKDQVTFPFSQPTQEDYGQMRVDQNLNQNDSLFVRYTIDNAARTEPLDFPQFSVNRGGRSQFLTAAENHVFSASLLNMFRSSYSRVKSIIDSPSELVGPQYSLVPGQQMGPLNVAGTTTFGPSGSTPNVKAQNIFTWSDDLFYTRGRHSLKFGTLINRFRQFTANGTNSKGTVTFASIPTFLQGLPSTYTAVTPGSALARAYHYTTLGFYVQDDLRLRPNLTFNLGLRYEFLTQPQEVKGFSAALRDMVHDANTTLGPAFENPTLRNFSPRFGFAWDVMGNGRTAVRGGFGLLYDIGNLGNALSAGAGAMPPFASLSTVRPTGVLTLPLTFPADTAGKALRVVDYHLQQPHLLQYNLTLERQLPLGMAMTLAYGGSRGMNLIQTKEGNPTVPQTLADGRQFWPVNAPRTNPFWSNIESKTAAGNSWYNSLQFGVSKRLAKGLQFQSSYTWSKVLDETQGQLNVDNNSSSTFGSDPTHRAVDRGPASFDVAQSWRFNTIYRLPGFSSLQGFSSKLLNGWWMSGILSVQSGYPFTPGLQTNRSRSLVNGGGAGIDRPDVIASRSNDSIILGGPDRYFDASAFSIPAAGFLGTLGRNTLRGPGFANLDFSMAKDTALRFLGEGGAIEFRAEIFNILNHANFGMPDRTVFAARLDSEPILATAGRITSTAGSSRQIQFALKLVF